MQASGASSSRGEATADYLRRARRLRARFAQDPVRMHRELRSLSKVHPAEARPVVSRVISRLPAAFPLQSRPAVAEAFAGEVERSLEGGVLRYSMRAKLLRQARQCGIGRFEANLIIATVQHRHGGVAAREQVAAGGDSRAKAVALFLMIQAILMAAAWWFIHA